MEINVQKFIEENYKEYKGNESFLVSPTKKTRKVWDKCKQLLKLEKEKGGVLDIETSTFSGINNFKPGYIDKENEVIVGLQTDKPLKRILNPYGGVRMAKKCLTEYGYEITPELEEKLNFIGTTHNDGVFSAYTENIKKARHNGLITGLPDAYGRGRIIGDYRRAALYGLDILIQEKAKELALYDFSSMSNRHIQLREEISMQIKSLKEIKKMALSYGIDISQPAKTAQEAIQAVYFAYLAGAKENNGAATSLGRVSTFFDIYIERDIEKGILTEETAQELIDQFIIKLRLIRHLRTPEYNELFAGDPTWVTESIGGMLDKDKSLVTKTSFRFLHSLENLGAAPEPNMTVLWHKNLPEGFKQYCARISCLTSAIQYENDKLMTNVCGQDYGIACCVSGMKLGEQMQFFGARCNLAKALLYALNEGRDEVTGELVIEGIPPIKKNPLDYEEVLANYNLVLYKLSVLYVQANNIIHYMHDKYAYESSQMAFHDSMVQHLMAFGVAGFSVAVDSLSAIKYAKVSAKRNKERITQNFIIKGNYPCYGNNDDKVDQIAVDLITNFYYNLRKQTLYKSAIPTLSILTITSNIVYGKKTGATPDGREAYTPFPPGANPMYSREKSGALSSLLSVAKIPYEKVCNDGISNTFTISPMALGLVGCIKYNNLIAILDTYFDQGGHHLNVNVMDKKMLEDAIEHPENYPTLTIRISGYAVHFNSLTKEQQKEILLRTFHK